MESENYLLMLTMQSEKEKAVVETLTMRFHAPEWMVAPNGSDTNDGLSWEMAKRTILSAYDSLPSSGNIFIAPDSEIGGAPEKNRKPGEEGGL